MAANQVGPRTRQGLLVLLVNTHVVGAQRERPPICRRHSGHEIQGLQV